MSVEDQAVPEAAPEAVPSRRTAPAWCARAVWRLLLWAYLLAALGAALVMQQASQLLAAAQSEGRAAYKMD